MSITPFFHVYHKYVFIMSNINKIRLSGQTYNIQDLNATKTVELTQAEYDALSQKDPNVFYIITDAKGADLSNYYTKSETSGATEISTALESKADTATTYTKTETDNAITAATSTKQDTLVSGTNIKTINNQSILGEGNITIEGGSGGGKAIEAGTNISITTGDTADTINCTLPIETKSNPYGVSQIYIGDNIYKNSNYEAIVIANKDDSSTGETRVELAHGAISIGSSNQVFQNGIAIGKRAIAGGRSSYGHIAIGVNAIASGSTKTNINNQLKIDTSNQVYIYNKDNTEMICLQDQLGGGGSSYTAGDGIDINNDVISVTGKVDTSTYNTYTAATDTALASKQTTLTAGTGISIVDNVISATGGGGGGESCTVDSTTMFYTFNHRYSNDALDMRVRYAVLDYGQDRTEIPNVSIDVNFRDANYNTYVNQNINLDYSTSSYTLGDISQAEYIDVTYDSTIEDFKIAVATAYTSTVFVGAINFWTGNIKVPFYTISSGSPCTAIENDIPTAISELGNNMLKGLRQINISSQKNAIYTYYETIGGNGEQRKLKLDEIDGSGSTLKPDIYVGLGRSGWTEINLSEQCNIDYLKATKYRVTYNDSELDTYSMGLQLTVEYAGNEMNDSVVFDETKHPSLQTQDVFSAATLDWNASTNELVITYPETIELYGKQESVNIGQIYSNGCNFGNAITKLESYGEEKQALKSYVKETRDALCGLKLVKLTQSEYDALATKDSSTLYIING